jgi:hypothetical protein
MMPPQNSKPTRNQAKKSYIKHQHSNKLSKSAPYTKTKPTSLKSTSSSKKHSKQLKYKNKSLIEELDDLVVGDLLHNTNKFGNNVKIDDLELQRNDEKLVSDIENAVKELENFVVKE